MHSTSVMVVGERKKERGHGLVGYRFLIGKRVGMGILGNLCVTIGSSGSWTTEKARANAALTVCRQAGRPGMYHNYSSLTANPWPMGSVGRQALGSDRIETGRLAMADLNVAPTVQSRE